MDTLITNILPMRKPDILNSSKPALFITMITALSACSSSDNGPLASGRGGTTNSLFSLDITDAPVDDADEVWIEFTGISIHPSKDDENTNLQEFTFASPKRINLLDLQGNKVQNLLYEEIIPSGSYDWIRLAVNAEQDSILDSYIKLKDGTEHELYIPGGSQTGLKLVSSFELMTNAEFNYTIDFDLRKSIVLTGVDNYILRPSLRLINKTESTTITGSVDASLLSTISAGCTDDDPVTGNAVYLFENANAIPDDINNTSKNLINSSLVVLNTNGNYEYTLGFIPQGDYTISFTCQSDIDNPETNDDIKFTGTSNISVTAGHVFNFDF